jgi:hypothetical protein
MFFALALVACREWEVPVFETETHPANVMLGDLHAYLGGEAEMTFAEDIQIAGRVVSSDCAGNFYNTFFIDDGTGAVEIMAGIPDLDAVYHPGQRISVRARGLAVGWRDGAMQIGLPPEPGNRFATGYFYHRAVMRSYITAERDVEPVEPLDISPAQFAPELCGRLVRIAGLEADLAGGSWASREPSPEVGYVKFRSPEGDSLTVVTSGYASFALAPVPEGRVTLTGILFYGRGGTSRDHYLLKLRDETDISY